MRRFQGRGKEGNEKTLGAFLRGLCFQLFDSSSCVSLGGSLRESVFIISFSATPDSRCFF